MTAAVARAIRKGHLGLAISGSALLAGCAVTPSIEPLLLPSPQAALKSREALAYQQKVLQPWHEVDHVLGGGWLQPSASAPQPAGASS